MNYRNKFDKEQDPSVDQSYDQTTHNRSHIDSLMKSTQPTTLAFSGTNASTAIKIVGVGESRPTVKSDERRPLRRKNSDAPYQY